MSKRVLFISPISSYPKNAGNRAHVNSLLLSLQHLNYAAYLIYIQATEGDSVATPDLPDQLI